MGGSKTTSKTVNKIPEWMSRAAEDLFYEAKGNVTPFAEYDPSASVDKYMNPYVDNVLTDSVNELIRANKIGKQGIAAKASSAGAFGGSRHGVAESEADRAMYEKIGQVSNLIKSQAYNQADETARSEHLRGQGYDMDQYRNLAAILAGSPHTTESTNTQKQSGGFGQIIGGGLALAGSLFSDERLKEDRSPTDGEEVLSAFEQLPVDEYEYKPEAQSALGVPDGKRIGPMAQDTQKLMGDQVSDGSQIDVAQLLGQVVAAIKALEERTDKKKAA